VKIARFVFITLAAAAMVLHVGSAQATAGGGWVFPKTKTHELNPAPLLLTLNSQAPNHSSY